MPDSKPREHVVKVLKARRSFGLVWICLVWFDCFVVTFLFCLLFALFRLDWFGWFWLFCFELCFLFGSDWFGLVWFGLFVCLFVCLLFMCFG